MSFQNEKILERFARLQGRLFVIRNKQLNPEEELTSQYVFEHSITDILDGIFYCDFEEAQSHLLYSIQEVEEILSGLKFNLSKYSFKDIPKGWNEGGFEISKGTDRQKQFKSNLITELKNYIQL